jgi:predicted transglutaminase-like cysteine proteinase
MSVLQRPSPSAVFLALCVFAAPAIASARQNARKPAFQPAAALSVDISATVPARYFTINEVLADRDMPRQPRASLRYASTNATATDARSAAGNPLPSPEPFGLSTFRAPEGLLWVKWRGVEQQMTIEGREVETCRSDGLTCSSATRRFVALVDAAKTRGGRARIEHVNRAINAAIRYTSDYAQHGVADLWTSPLATLASGRGDCEDYAIAKYVILLEAGVRREDLRLLLVRDRAVRQDHAVLAVRDNGRWLVLDNRHLTLSETASLSQFTPLFSLDHQGVSLFAAPYAARPAVEVELSSAAPPTAASDAGVSPTTVATSASLSAQ